MKDIGVVIILVMQKKGCTFSSPFSIQECEVMMAASSADYKDDSREEEEPVTQEGRKPLSNQ